MFYYKLFSKSFPIPLPKTSYSGAGTLELLCDKIMMQYAFGGMEAS